MTAWAMLISDLYKVMPSESGVWEPIIVLYKNKEARKERERREEEDKPK
jgi:hypothetical protein